MLDIIQNNPYRILGVLSNSPLRERIGNQNRLVAFSKIGKEISFPNDFISVIETKPQRNAENIASANTALNLDRDQLKYALFWFINGSSIDNLALKHLQSGNKDKAKELFEKKETFSSILNIGILHLIEGNYSSGFSNISKVIHNSVYRAELLSSLGLHNLTMTEDDIASMFIEEIIKEASAATLLATISNSSDKTLICKIALDEPISTINSAIAIAKSANARDSKASLEAGTRLMDSTKNALKQVKDIAGAKSSQYQVVADNLAKQILQCGINYYNHATEDDINAPRKAMALQKYALKIAVGKLTKDRCQDNYDIIKKAVENMPPAEVAVENSKVKDELRKFQALPDKISHSMTLLNNTKPLLQTIKTKLGATNPFYLSLSTQVVGNALHNLIEEVNETQNHLTAIIAVAKEAGVSPAMLNYLGDELSPARIIDKELKPVLRESWRVIAIMDTFDMESDFRTNRYNTNRKSLKEICEKLGISTYISPIRTTTPKTASCPIKTKNTTTVKTASRPTKTKNTTTTSSPSSNNESSSDSNNAGWIIFWFMTIICAFLCAIFGTEGFFCGAILGAIFGNILRKLLQD